MAVLSYTSAALLLFSIYLLRVYILSKQKQKEAKRLALERGCAPAPKWNAKWPLGLDMLFRAVGHAREGNILQFMLDVTAENGVTFQQDLLGARGIDTIDPRNVEVVLSTNFSDYGLGLRSPTFHPLLGSGIFTQDGQAWKLSRQQLRPQFSQHRDSTFVQIQNCVQQDLIDTIVRESGVDGRPVDLQPLFFKLTFDTTLFLLFGDSIATMELSSSQESAFARAFVVGQDYLSHRGRLGPFYWLLNDRTFRNACKLCHRFVDDAVDMALRNISSSDSSAGPVDPKNYSFVQDLAQKTQDRLVLRDQALNVLLAGRDTTGCCLTWTFRLLSRHQDVLARLRDEVKSVCGIGPDAEPPTRKQLKCLPYLSIVIKEGKPTEHQSKQVLRLYPSVPVNSREAAVDTVLPVGGGPDGKSPIFVRAREAVGYCVYAMHRRKDIYGPDADVFRPERWNDAKLDAVGWGYLPFNGGPRVCLGQEFALLEIYYTVARLIQVFPNITLPPDEPIVLPGKEKQKLTLIVAPADGCRVCMGTS